MLRAYVDHHFDLTTRDLSWQTFDKLFAADDRQGWLILLRVWIDPVTVESPWRLVDALVVISYS